MRILLQKIFWVEMKIVPGDFYVRNSLYSKIWCFRWEFYFKRFFKWKWKSFPGIFLSLSRWIKIWHKFELSSTSSRQLKEQFKWSMDGTHMPIYAPPKKGGGEGSTIRVLWSVHFEEARTFSISVLSARHASSFSISSVITQLYPVQPTFFLYKATSFRSSFAEASVN